MDPNQYLIIGGSTKCGTTSVFNYFEYHPQVCPCTMKESRYFWTNAYPLTAATRNTANTEKFSDLFRNCQPRQVRLEATPDYLYSLDSATAIRKEIPGCKLVFILREPVSRLKSWYKFSLVNGLIPEHTSFETYIKLQENPEMEVLPQHLRAFEQGNYSKYIANYINIFGKENVLVTFYEDLVAHPENFCKAMAGFAGIDKNYFNNFDFKIFNKTVPAGSVAAHQFFRRFKRSVRPVTRLFNAAIRKKIKLAGHHFENAYQSANRNEQSAQIYISAYMSDYLEAGYHEDRTRLLQFTGGRSPW